MELAKKSVVCITINTDASWHPIHKVGGYAFYIVCDLFKIQKAGMFKRNPTTAEEAEIMCIGNAIATLLAQRELPTAKWLIINTDCKWAINRINQGQRGIDGLTASMKKELIERMQIQKNEFRWVPSHTGSTDARSWVNEWCDTEAKKWMRKALAKQRTP